MSMIAIGQTLIGFICLSSLLSLGASPFFVTLSRKRRVDRGLDLGDPEGVA